MTARPAAVRAAMPDVVATIVPVRGPAKEESGKEDHRDDEYHAGDDAYPRKSFNQPARPVMSVVDVFGTGFRCVTHAPIMRPTG